MKNTFNLKYKASGKKKTTPKAGQKGYVGRIWTFDFQK